MPTGYTYVIAASAGIGELARSTRSILFCGSVHALGNITAMFGLIAKNLSGSNKLIIVGICIAVWVPIIRRFIKISRPQSQ